MKQTIKNIGCGWIALLTFLGIVGGFIWIDMKSKYDLLLILLLICIIGALSGLAFHIGKFFLED